MDDRNASGLRIRTLMVDDHAAFLDELRRFLEDNRDSDVVGRAASGEEALEQTKALRPDLVLMDLAMPGMGGLEATRRLKGEAGAPRVIMLSMHEHPLYRQAALDAGADGFIPKSELGDALLPLIHSLFPTTVENAV